MATFNQGMIEGFFKIRNREFQRQETRDAIRQMVRLERRRKYGVASARVRRLQNV